MPLPRFDKLDEPRKKAILAAAAEEFGARGFEQASYNQIIERAGLSKGAMYYYFADKDDLYRTVLGTAAALLIQHLVPVEAQAPDADSFWLACEANYVRCLRFFMDDPQSAALCMSVMRARERREAHPALAALNEQTLGWMRELVRHGQRVGAVRKDVSADFLVLMGMALGEAGDRWITSRWEEMTKDSIEATAKMMTDLFKRVGGPETKSQEQRQKPQKRKSR
jgi:AcrR family transcriptional regulator